MVFGVGGGKALDTVKCLCITDDKPVFTFPTIASNCAACTSVSIMYNSDGTFLNQKLRVDAYIMQNSTPMRPAEITCIRQLLNLTPAPIQT